MKFILNNQETTVEAEEGRSLLDLALIARINPPYSCLEGNCRSCLAVIEFGDVGGDVPEDKDEKNVVRTCQAVPRSELVVANYDKVAR
ncbi:2Fe-2S iron-sulfur cluster binding domain-containing protein [Bdellovibrio sp. NC01]|uniref:2Fe-2S iron-sulfur cluster binding domain-containing protein n=1 Tax=Bdellovibrio sp. NC01 TaxID=2220073 RepID=UPI00143CC0C3|nr:2Fe-2S iron-sulfur cluster binding domain-containing protein [Bdellovibrio sp. NC01]